MSLPQHPTRTQFRASDRIVVTDHARRRWRERGWGIDPEDPLDDRGPGYAADVAWRRARHRPVPWGTQNARYVRYDSQTDCLLIARRHHTGQRARLYLVTVERARWELDRLNVRRAVESAIAEAEAVGEVPA